MFNPTSVPSNLHAHPPCKVNSRAQKRTRRMLPQVKMLDQTTFEFVIVFFSFSFISRKQKSSTGWNVKEIYITIRSKFTSIPQTLLALLISLNILLLLCRVLLLPLLIHLVLLIAIVLVGSWGPEVGLLRYGHPHLQ